MSTQNPANSPANKSGRSGFRPSAQPGWPLPDRAACQASLALTATIQNTIRQSGGWIPFSSFMEQVLYAPQHGYYSGGSVKLGAGGDFTTAPELCPLFGSTLARFYHELMTARTLPSAAPVLEFGAGSGRLCLDFLRAAAERGCLPTQYLIVELSSELRDRQRQNVEAAGFGTIVAWADTLPAAFGGLILGNEVLDAMPVELVIKGVGGWLQRGVILSDMVPESTGDDMVGTPVAGLLPDSVFSWLDRPLPPVLQLQLASQLAAAGIEPDDLPEGYLTEIHPVGCGFMRSLAAMQCGGSGSLALLFDYGFPAAEYYLLQRHQGTLMCHYRHHAHADPFLWPGLQDVTAHVDFSAMALAAQDAGLTVCGYTSQAGFLLSAGITDELSRTSPEDVLAYAPLAGAVQKLLSPAEMGELFKVLVLGAPSEHGDTGWPARFEAINRVHTL